MCLHIPAHKNTDAPAGQVAGSFDIIQHGDVGRVERPFSPLRASHQPIPFPLARPYSSRTCNAMCALDWRHGCPDSSFLAAVRDCLDAPPEIPAGYTARSYIERETTNQPHVWRRYVPRTH